MSTLEERPRLVSSIPQDYTKRLMVFGGRASMELAARIARHLDVDVASPTARFTAATRSRFAAPTCSSSSRRPPTRRTA